MAKKAKKVSAVRQEYMKQRRRIQEFIRRAEKRGYQFKKDILDKEIPKRVTKKLVEALTYLTPDRLYAKAVKIEEGSGKEISGTRARAAERTAAGKKGYKTQQARKKAEQAFWTEGQPISPEASASASQPVSEEKPQKGKAPKANRRDLGKTPPPGVVPADSGLAAYYETVEPYIKRLSEKPGMFYDNIRGQKRRRSQQLLAVSEQARVDILGKLNQLVSQIGKSKVGWIFKDHEDELMYYLDYVLYGSNASELATAVIHVTNILNKGLGEQTTQSQLEQLSEMEEQEEDWSDFD